MHSHIIRNLRNSYSSESKNRYCKCEHNLHRPFTGIGFSPNEYSSLVSILLLNSLSLCHYDLYPTSRCSMVTSLPHRFESRMSFSWQHYFLRTALVESDCLPTPFNNRISSFISYFDTICYIRRKRAVIFCI